MRAERDYIAAGSDTHGDVWTIQVRRVGAPSCISTVMDVPRAFAQALGRGRAICVREDTGPLHLPVGLLGTGRLQVGWGAVRRLHFLAFDLASVAGLGQGPRTLISGPATSRSSRAFADAHCRPTSTSPLSTNHRGLAIALEGSRISGGRKASPDPGWVKPGMPRSPPAAVVMRRRRAGAVRCATGQLQKP